MMGTEAPRSRRGLVAGMLALALILVLVIAGAVRYRDVLLRFARPTPVSTNASAPVDATSGNQVSLPEPGADPASESNAAASSDPSSIVETDGPQLTPRDAAYYLPMPYRAYRYYEEYPDGDRGEWTLIAASLQEPLPVSGIEVLANPKDYVRASFHYLQQGGKIYRVEDAQPRQAELLLTSPMVVGTVFRGGGMVGKVIQAGVATSVNGHTYTDCLVITRHYEAVGYRNIEYWAPGYGIVLVKAPGGAVLRKLLNVQEVDAQRAVDQVQRETPNIDKVRVP